MSTKIAWCKHLGKPVSEVESSEKRMSLFCHGDCEHCGYNVEKEVEADAQEEQETEVLTETNETEETHAV
jgi:hypothetical protein